MADFVRVPESDWQAICDAVRGKTGGDEALLSGQLAENVSGITTDPALKDLTVTENGEYIPDEGVDGFGKVTVNVKIEPGGSSDGTTAGLLNGTLEEIVNTEVTSLRDYALYKHQTIKKATFPNVTANCSANALRDCSSLELFDAPCAALTNACFNNCPVLTTLILRKTDNICSLIAINALGATPFAVGGSGGTVYVPEAMIPEYQQATNWATLYAAGTCNFVAIEGSEYE